MSPEQKAALEALVGRALTADEATAIEPYISDANNRNDVQIAALLPSRPPKLTAGVVSTRGAAAKFPALNGLPRSYSMEVALLKLETFVATYRDAQLPAPESEGFAVAYMTKIAARAVGRKLEEFQATGLDFSEDELRDRLDDLAAQNVITAAEADGFKALALQPDPISVLDVSRALNVAENRMNLG